VVTKASDGGRVLHWAMMPFSIKSPYSLV
jgi:hypothetical protein